MSNIIPFGIVRFTAEDVTSFCQVALSWIQRDLCGAILRTRAGDVDILLVMGDGSKEPLWGVAKDRDQSYWLFTRSRKPLASGRTIEEVLHQLNLDGEQVGALLH